MLNLKVIAALVARAAALDRILDGTDYSRNYENLFDVAGVDYPVAAAAADRPSGM